MAKRHPVEPEWCAHIITKVSRSPSDCAISSTAFDRHRWAFPVLDHDDHFTVTVSCNTYLPTAVLSRRFSRLSDGPRRFLVILIAAGPPTASTCVTIPRTLRLIVPINYTAKAGLRRFPSIRFRRAMALATFPARPINFLLEISVFLLLLVPGIVWAGVKKLLPAKQKSVRGQVVLVSGGVCP